MSGKYADRFRESPSEPSRDVLDLGELDSGNRTSSDHDHDHDDAIYLGPGPDRPWHGSWVARLALVAMLVVGVAGGAYGWERWRVREAEIAARSSVDLFATALTLNYAAEDQVSVAIEYQNDGPHVIVIRDARFDTDDLAVIRAPSVLEVASGETKTHILQLQAECPPSGPQPWEALPLVVTIETVDGTVRDQIIDGLPIDVELRDWFSYACQMGMYQPSFSDTYADFSAATQSSDGRSVDVRVTFGFDAGTRVQIDHVEPRSAAFAVEYAPGDLNSGPSFLGPYINVTYRVDDCELALDASEDDMGLIISGSVEDSAPGTLTAYPSPALAIELSRLAFASCAG